MSKNIIIEKCINCGNEFEIKKCTLASRKIHNVPIFCSACMKPYMKNKRKQIFSTPSVKKKISVGTKLGQSKMTEEAKQQQKENLSKSTIKRYKESKEREKTKIAVKNVKDNMTEKEKQEHSELIKQGLANMTPEAKRKMKENQSISHKKNYMKMNNYGKEKLIQPLLDYITNESTEQKENRYQKTSISMMKHYEDPHAHEITSKSVKFALANMSESKKIELSNKRKNNYNKKSDEEKITQIANLHTNRDNYYLNLTYSAHVKNDLKNINESNKESLKNILNIIKNLNMINNIPERDFIQLLLSIHPNILFNYQWYNIYEHPKFKKLFPNNPVTGANFVSPFHQWDFRILTNQCDIFVDIDGSIHDPSKNNSIVRYYNGISYNLGKSIKFNDSQRIYQTDDCPAYIIQCYDDKLTENSKVINILDDKDNITLKEFVELIKKGC